MTTDNVMGSFHPVIENFQQEVKAYFESLRIKNDSIRFQLLYSPFFENAEILILGFNPGLGDENCFDVMERKQLEYLIHDSYPTAKDTKYVFEKAGLTDVLEGKIVKSNIFYLATKQASHLYPMANKLNELPKFLFYQKHYIWARELVEKCAAKLIILEGSMAFEEFKKAIEEDGFAKVKNLFGLDGVFYGEIDFSNKTIPYIGYQRTRFGMKNKDAFAALLAKTYQQIL